MNETLTITFKGREYSVTVTNTMEVLWTCEATSMAPPLSLSQMLNRCVIDRYAQEALATWGREDLPQYLRWLNALGATSNDMQRLGVASLVPTQRGAAGWSGTPLYVLGYRAGKNGQEEAERREVLRRAVLGDLPFAGSEKYMAKWGLPGTSERVRRVLMHLKWRIPTEGKPGADFSQVLAHTESDIQWLKNEFTGLLNEAKHDASPEN